MNDANGPRSEGDFERLAARVAMLASDDGEADNAGRAVGALARRIGLTGGDLKRIFLAGAASEATPDQATEPRHELEREVLTLRRSVRLMHVDARNAVAERESLYAEITELQTRLYRARTVTRGCSIAIGVAVAGLLLSTTLLVFGGPARRADPPQFSGLSMTGPRAAVIRQGGGVLYREPDRASLPVANLPAGTHIQVRRLVWKALIQWAEVEIPGGRLGYVLTTEVDLS